jgi:hypothetical protein
MKIKTLCNVIVVLLVLALFAQIAKFVMHFLGYGYGLWGLSALIELIWIPALLGMIYFFLTFARKVRE